VEVLFGAAIGAIELDDGRDLGVLTREPPIVVHIARHILRRKQRIDLVEPKRELLELRRDAGLHARAFRATDRG
jgi:hypothetical protein